MRASTDNSLLRQFQAGDDRAASALYARYVRRLRGLAQRHHADDLAPRVDSDDILQSAFRSFFRGAREGLYQAPPGGELWQLLATITRHKLRRARVHHRADKRDVRVTQSVEPPERLADDDLAAAQDLKLLFEELLSTRPAVERQIVLLRVEGHQVNEIAERTHRSRRTVERVLQEVRDELLSILLPSKDATGA